MVLVVGAIILATFAFVVIWLPDKWVCLIRHKAQKTLGFLIFFQETGATQAALWGSGAVDHPFGSLKWVQILFCVVIILNVVHGLKSYAEINRSLCRLSFGAHCSLWSMVDPTLQRASWLPVFIFIAIFCISAYVKIAWIARKARKAMQGQQQVQSVGVDKEYRNSRSRTTQGLLLVSVIFLVSNTVWFITFYATFGSESQAALLERMLLERFWEVKWIFLF